MTGKIIKKITRILSYVLLFLILLPVIISFVIQIPSLQNYAVKKTVGWIADEIGSDLQYSSVRITTFNRIRFTNLLISDQEGDTVIFSGRIKATTPSILTVLAGNSFSANPVKRMDLHDAVLKLTVDSSKNLNFQHIIDYINSKSRSGHKPSQATRINRISLKNSRFDMKIYSPKPDSIGIDFSNMRLSNLDCRVSELKIKGDTVGMNIELLSFIENSGFEVKSYTSTMELSNTYLYFGDISIITEESDIEASRVKMDFGSFKDFQPEYLYDKVIFDIGFDQSSVQMNDVGYFADFFNNYKQKFKIKGELSGAISNFKGKKLNVTWGDNSNLSGDFNMNGLPQAKETFLFFRLNEMSTTIADITSLNLPRNQRLEIPEFLQRLTSIRYEGNFTGFFNDFVAKGKLTTNLGIISTDLMFTPDSLNAVSVTGKLNTHDFRLGELANNTMLGNISMEMSVNGLLAENENIVADLDGKITRLTFKNYNYRNIDIRGKLSDKHFDGNVIINDPNLVFEFNGLVDMASELPRYDFKLNVIDANLHALNITPADSGFHASFLLKANAKGKDFDQLNGEFKLLNSLFTKSEDQIQIYDANIIVRNKENSNELIIRSDLVDAEITGKYTFSMLADEYKWFARRYLPSLFANIPSSPDSLYRSKIAFNFLFKETQYFFKFFLPEYTIGDDSRLTGYYNPESTSPLTCTFITSLMKIKGNTLNGVVLNIDTEDSSLLANVGSQSVVFDARAGLENLTLESTLNKDKLFFKTQWLNWDSTMNSGKISGTAEFYNPESSKRLSVSINPSAIIINDAKWDLEKLMLFVDTAGVSVDHLLLRHMGQNIKAHGKISGTPEDTLHFSFTNFDLENLNYFIRGHDMQFSGLMNGSGNLTGFKTNPLFFAGLEIQDCIFNGEKLGTCTIQSLWDNRKQSLNMNGIALRGQGKILEVQGDYYPSKNGKLDFEINFDNIRSAIVAPFMQGIFSDFRGFVSGNLLLSGHRSNPILTGDIDISGNSFEVDYLKTRYMVNKNIEVVNKNIEVVNNTFIFDNIPFTDEQGNRGMMNGMIRAEHLKDLSLNLNLEIESMLCMDTRENDNESFYGTAYATGNINIKGNAKNLNFEIDATTDEKTKLFIPLNQVSEVSDYGYVRFNRSDTANITTKEDENLQKVDLAGIQMNFNLHVTPDAEVQIIFDPTMGDIIKTNGSGELVLTINTLGTFDMAGEYIIEKGDYLFTLKNVINKRLKIDEGSTLRWTGDPVNANVDITAVYRTKASLSELFKAEIADEEMGQRVTVDCRIFLSGRLLSPEIKYDIYLPSSDEDTRNRVQSVIGSEEDLSKQFLTLLVMNQFMVPGGSQSNDGYMAGVSNASELFSNQLSNWVSQISNSFDLGFTYRPEDDISSEEIEVALSTQLLNNRLSINGSVDMKTGAVNANKFAGDIDVDYKLNKKGKIRLRAFNRTNYDLLEEAPSTQGVGILYKEEFNTFSELLSHYWAALTGKKEKIKPEEADIETN